MFNKDSTYYKITLFIFYTIQIFLSIFLIKMFLHYLLIYITIPTCIIGIFYTLYIFFFKIHIYFEVPIILNTKILFINWFYLITIRLLFLTLKILERVFGFIDTEFKYSLTWYKVFLFFIFIAIIYYFAISLSIFIFLLIWVNTPVFYSDLYCIFNEKLTEIYYNDDYNCSVFFFSNNIFHFRCGLKGPAI